MLWNVPITIATKTNPEAVKFVLDKASDTVTIEGVGPNDWILVSGYLQSALSIHVVVCLFLIFLY